MAASISSTSMCRLSMIAWQCTPGNLHLDGRPPSPIRPAFGSSAPGQEVRAVVVLRRRARRSGSRPANPAGFRTRSRTVRTTASWPIRSSKLEGGTSAQHAVVLAGAGASPRPSRLDRRYRVGWGYCRFASVVLDRSRKMIVSRKPACGTRERNQPQTGPPLALPIRLRKYR